MSIRATMLVVVFATLLGCTEPPPPITSLLTESAERIVDVESALETVFVENDVIHFRSWDGRFIGTDCDAEITIHSDGTIALTEYGYSIQKYTGSYTIVKDSDASSRLVFKIDEYERTWPAIAVYTDANELVFLPTEINADSEFLTHDGGKFLNAHGRFWPFRQIPVTALQED